MDVQLLWHKIKEALVSVLPVTVIVVILHFTPWIQLTNMELIIFLASALLLIIGIGLFNLGADMAMQPMGEQVGASLMKTKKIKVIAIVCFVMGVLITIAEPDLSVLASQVSDVINQTVLIVSIGVGVGLFLVFAVLNIIFIKYLSFLLVFFYFAMFALVSLVLLSGNGYFLALSFDSGGVTTGPITVPFIMSLGVGVATTIGGKNTSENSFGLIALCSIGPILAILILGMTIQGEMVYEIPNYAVDPNFFGSLFHTMVEVGKEVILALGLIVVFFLIIQLVYLHLPKIKLIRIAIGIAYTFIGLVLFLSAVTIGFMPVGYKLGTYMAQHPALLVVFGFILGMLLALSIGVGISIGLSMIRIIFDFSILYYIIPGYFISLGLALFVPRLYTAIAFDSGGVASGALTSSFILPFAVGACIVLQSSDKVLDDAFGIVAMVAMTPLITIQLLGFKSLLSKRMMQKIRSRRIDAAEDEQIISFL